MSAAGTSESGCTLRVLIAGAGFAALEAALALRALAGDRVSLTFVAPEPLLHYRPAASTELFAGTSPLTYDLRTIAQDLGAKVRLGRLQSVASTHRMVRLSTGARLGYDKLVLAIGSRAKEGIPGARVFRDQRDVPAFRLLLEEIASQRTTRLVFAIPTGSSWPVPLYELALLAAEHGERGGSDLEISIVTPEAVPLAAFGPGASRVVAQLLDQRRVRFLGGRVPIAVRRGGPLELRAGEVVDGDEVVTVPQLTAHRIGGIPASWWGFVPTDGDGRVQGRQHIYAAGDMTAFPVKHGGLATQQADRVAQTIARELGMPIKRADQRMVLQAHLIGGRTRLCLRAELDWRGRPTADSAGHVERPGELTPTKVVGRYVAPYLEGLTPAAA